jgi:hypothetical protein
MRTPVTDFPRLPCFVSAGAFSLTLLFTGCVSGKYQAAPKDTPPPQLLKVGLAAAPLGVTLDAVITYNGPGSWKRDAFWDEYVVTFHNPTSQPLTVAAEELTDFTGTLQPAGSDPWALEMKSKSLEQKYHENGVAFARYTTPGLLIGGTGVVLMAGAGGIAAGATAAATVVLLPIYYAGVLTINHYNKVAMEKEFTRRRLGLPLTLTPGETRTGSFFFPMVPNPRSLGLHWSTGPDSGVIVFPLDFLHGLHIGTQKG